MRVFGVFAAAAVCLLAAMGSRSAAAVYPTGSYQQTCSAIRMQNGYLYANCQDVNGNEHPSMLDMRSCPSGNVGNSNGNLVCEQNYNGGGGYAQHGYNPGGYARNGDGDRDDHGRSGSRLPGGSWRASCQNARLDTDDHIFYANCQTDNGNWNRSWLNMQNCPSRQVGNNNGDLFCESGYGTTYGGALPPGSWQQSCRNAQMAGTMLYADCDTGYGYYQASSLDVSACPSGPVGNNHGRLYCGAY